MYPHAKEALVRNRAKMLQLAAQDKIDYLIISSALYEKHLLPKKKHVEIRDGKNTNILRVDALLEWAEDLVHKPDFLEALVVGIKRSEQGLLAKKFNKEALGPITRPPGLLLSDPFLGLAGPTDVVKPKKPKIKKEQKDSKMKLPKTFVAVATANMERQVAEPLPPTPVVDVNGIKPKATPKSAQRKGKKNEEPTVVPAAKAPSTPVAPPMNRRKSKIEAGLVSASKSKPVVDGIAAGDVKILSPVVAPTPSRKRKSDAIKTDSKFNPQNSIFGYFKKENLPKSETTITAANKKLANASRAFTFRNDGVTFGNLQLGQLFYEGCANPTANHGLCTKKVTKKGDSYSCAAQHKTVEPVQVPRLQLTLGDSSGEMEATMWRTSVEILAGRSSSELQRMNEQELQQAFAATKGKKYSVYVETEKVSKRDMKKFGKMWNLNATILVDENGPVAKKRG